MAKDFRNEGMDRNHNPEFTMLEFYWAYADYEDCMNLVEELFHQVAKIVGSHNLSWGDNHIDLSKKFHRKPFLEVLVRQQVITLMSLMKKKSARFAKKRDRTRRKF